MSKSKAKRAVESCSSVTGRRGESAGGAVSEIGLALPWPQRVIDDLGGRAPAVGDWYAECCLLDMGQITDEERLAELQDLYSDMDTGGTWARSEAEIRGKLAEWQPRGFTNAGSQVHGAMSLVHRAPNGDEVYMPEDGDEVYTASNQPVDEGLGERVLAQVIAFKNQPNRAETSWYLPYRDDQGDVVLVPARPLEHIEFNVTVTPDGSSTHCYGTDAADGSGLVNKLTPASYPSEAETALLAAACAGSPGAEHLLPNDIGRLLVLYDERGLSAIDDDSDLQEGNARWLRHTVEVGGGATQHIQVPATPKAAGGKMRWSSAVVAALIALVVMAALCADIFAVPYTAPVATIDDLYVKWSKCPADTYLLADVGCMPAESLTEFVPDLPRRIWIGPVVPVGWDCRYFGKATAARNWVENQCIDAQFHAGDARAMISFQQSVPK